MSKEKNTISARQSRHRLGDLIFKHISIFAAFVVLSVMVGMIVMLSWNSRVAIQTFGFQFFTSRDWNPFEGTFGALTSVYGTFITTFIALVISVPLSIVIALFLVELAPEPIKKLVGLAIELLAAVPSIIYGMWGLFILAPIMSETIQPFFTDTLKIDKIPLLGKLFDGYPMGIGIFTAGIVLSIMVLPYISMIMRDVFLMVPSVVKESAYGIGCTTWEVTKRITLPYGIQGIVGACFLGLGRAVGETMAVAFVIGNSHEINLSLYSPATSIASTIANEFGEATEPVYMNSLILLGLVLLVFTIFIQIISQIWIKYIQRKMGTGL